MDNGANEAQMITRVVLGGSVFILKLSGTGIHQMAKFLSAAMNGEYNTSGLINMKTLLKSGQPLKVYSIRGDENFRSFARGAKEYGIVYSVIKRSDTDKNNEVYEIMVKQNDAAKINRVIEKYHLMELQDSGGTAENVSDTINRALESEESAEMKIEDIRSLLAKMLDNQGEEELVNFPLASENENLSDAESNYSAEEEVELFERVPGTPVDERQSVRSEVKQIISESDNDINNTIGANPSIIAQMLAPADAEEEDKQKDIAIMQEAMTAAFSNIIKEAGGTEHGSSID
ncbi:MAG: PcfB family protein [Eubacterium sp.]|nr:PcfB family protein [Eubacterium sp.]